MMTQDAFWFFTIALGVAGLVLESVIVILAWKFKSFVKQQITERGDEVVTLLNGKGGSEYGRNTNHGTGADSG